MNKKFNFDGYLYNAFLLLCFFLPFQFALNPAPGIDLAIIRVLIPIFFVATIFAAKFQKKNFFIFDRITKILLCFLFFATISLIFSHNFSWSLRKLFFLFSLFPVYFISRYLLNSKNKQRQAVTSLVLGATILSFFSLLQFFAQFIFGIDAVYQFLANHISPFFLGKTFSQTVLAYPSWLVNSAGVTYMRAVAVFPDPHMLSYYFGILIPWAIALWATAKKRKKIFLLSIIFLLLADILTFTRGGYIALIASSLIIIPFVSSQVAKKMMLGIFILSALFFITPQNPVSGRFSSSFDMNEGSNQGRIYNWRQALPVIFHHPFGVGIGMYSLAVDPNANYREPIYAHNLYLDISAELGLQTTIVFLSLLIFSALFFLEARKQDSFFIAGLASIMLFATHSLVESPLYSVHVLTLFLIILSLAAKLPDEKISDN